MKDCNFGKLFCQPTELVDSLVSRIQQARPLCELPLLLFLSCNTTSSIKVDFKDIPEALIRACLKEAPPASFRQNGSRGALSSISFHLQLGDSLFEALAGSYVAETLLELDISEEQITDASAHCWHRFSSLRSLMIGSKQLTLKTYEEVARTLSSLTSLKVDVAAEPSDAFRVLEAFLSPSCAFLKTLQQLRFYSPMPLDSEKADLAAFDSALRTSLAQCDSLQRLTFSDSLFAAEDRLCALCPNLHGVDHEFKPTFAELRRLAPLMKQFRSLVIFREFTNTFADGYEEPFPVITHDSIEWIGSNFENLASLEMGSWGNLPQIQAPSFRRLSNLERLDAYCKSWNCFSFPSSLTELSITIPELPDEMLAQLCTQFLACIPSELQLLRRLSFTVRCLLEVYQAILAGLPNLEEVQFGSPLVIDKTDREFFIFSHPKLRTINLEDVVIDYSDHVVLGDLPSLESCKITSNCANMLGSSLSSLTSVEVLAKITNLQPMRLLPSLCNLRCDLSFAQLESLALFHRLEELELSLGALEPNSDPELLSALLLGLPNLRKFSLSLLSPLDRIASFGWLKHQKLQHLEFSSSIRSARRILVRLCEADLPLLRTLHLDINPSGGLQLFLEGLPTLHALRFRGTGLQLDPKLVGSQVDVRIISCPSLQTVAIGAFLGSPLSFSQIEIRDLPALANLLLSECTLTEATIFDVTAPSLRSYHFRNLSPDPAEHARIAATLLATSPLARDCL